MPDVEVTTNFFLVLTIVADVRRRRHPAPCARVRVLAPGVPGRGAGSRRCLGDQARARAWIVALGRPRPAASATPSTSTSSLRAVLVPTDRHVPALVILGVGWLRRDKPGLDDRARRSSSSVCRSRLPLARRAGAELRPGLVVLDRRTCSSPYFEKLGFVTLAWMCLSSFLLIAACSRSSSRRRVAPATTTARRDLMGSPSLR